VPSSNSSPTAPAPPDAVALSEHAHAKSAAANAQRSGTVDPRRSKIISQCGEKIFSAMAASVASDHFSSGPQPRTPTILAWPMIAVKRSHTRRSADIIGCHAASAAMSKS